MQATAADGKVEVAAEDDGGGGGGGWHGMRQRRQPTNGRSIEADSRGAKGEDYGLCGGGRERKRTACHAAAVAEGNSVVWRVDVDTVEAMAVDDRWGGWWWLAALRGKRTNNRVQACDPFNRPRSKKEWAGEIPPKIS